MERKASFLKNRWVGCHMGYNHTGCVDWIGWLRPTVVQVCLPDLNRSSCEALMDEGIK